MNLFAIAGSFRRHKWAVIPVIILTLVAMFYFTEVKASTYTSAANVLLENPPVGPSVGQIELNHKLAEVDANNPLASLGNLSQVADVLCQTVLSAAETQKLEQEGASAGYQAVPDASYDNPPAIDITGAGPTPQSAEQTAQLVAQAIQQELYQIQVDQHINKSYLVTSIEYVTPTTATPSSSSKLRSVLVVLVIGLMLLLVTVSISQSIAEKKKAAIKPEREWSSSGERISPERMSSAVPNDRYGTGNPSGARYDQAQRPPMRATNDPQAVNPMYSPEVQNLQGDRRWG